MNDIDLAPAADRTSTPAVRRVLYEIHDRMTLAISEPHSSCLDVWSPVICDTPYQRVLDIRIDAPGGWQTAREPEFGNLMSHSRTILAGAATIEISFDYLVERLPLTHDLAPRPANPAVNTALFRRFLQPERYVDVDHKTRGLARDIAGGETDPLAQARRLYDYVTATMEYDSARQSWKGSTEHALLCSVGNCNDIHALFISLARSLGIPARFVLGQALEEPRPGEAACELCGYHCWAEFFVAGAGWVPADASCACKYGKHALFGTLESNHIAWSIGRDVLLAPPCRGARPLFFAGPYAELDGQPCSGIQRVITFAAAR